MSKPLKPPEEEAGESVGLWYISFADMITLLMSFFVMLQTMATDKNALLMRTGQQSFKRAIEGFGMPDWLYGKPQKPEYDYKQLRYPVHRQDQSTETNRIIDDTPEQIKKVYDELNKAVPTKANDVAKQVPVRRFPAVRFAGDSSSLDEASKNELARLSGEIQGMLGMRRIEICVTGLAPDVSGVREQWVLSAQRAAKVEEYLRQLLAPQFSRHAWEILSKGMGDGKAAARSLGTTDKQTHIVITITDLNLPGS
ncbi:MAG: OmpA family protein [Planctomycetes bacterium]|nr:OmpA family protein [Planctomycetota bacterium]